MARDTDPAGSGAVPRIPDAQTIAPSAIAAFVAMSLPATLISGTGVSVMAGFYIVVLSTCQVIFFGKRKCNAGFGNPR